MANPFTNTQRHRKHRSQGEFDEQQMNAYYHTFHIPVMGTGHSVDTPIRVAHFGISSVISLVDDILLETIRKHYCRKFNLPYSEIPRKEDDGRAKRITAYLNTLDVIVRINLEAIKNEPFAAGNDKSKYFELLPDESPLKKDYNEFLSMKQGHKRDALAKDLTDRMQPGSIDVNIMVNLDKPNVDRAGKRLGDTYNDAKAALRGYANSGLRSSIVFSAGINQRLFTYMACFPDFYRDERGDIKKKIILKVSDFRSALIQGRFLAKKGLEIHEFRIESGLNCGGHAFPSNGYLLPYLLKEFKEKRELFIDEFQPLILDYYKKMGWPYPETALHTKHLITVQGGIGTNGEMRRIMEEFHIDRTGWAGPFLLVPEATCVDKTTRELLRQSSEDDLYMSQVSPLNILFNNIRNTGAERWTAKMINEGNPGSTCPKGFLAFNTEFTDRPLCLASRQYQKMKLESIDGLEISEDEKEKLRKGVLEKFCICHQLGNGALIALGIADEDSSPQCICPGPNVAWFNKIYTLKEMVDHIYGRGPSLVSSERPHVFAKEIVMYVDYFETQVSQCAYTSKDIKTLQEFKTNLEDGMDLCLDIAKSHPYPGENLASISPCVQQQRVRLRSIYTHFEANAKRAESKPLEISSG